MAVCRVASVVDLHPGGGVSAPLAFQVTLDAAEPLAEDVTVRCIFIADAADPSQDVELDAIVVSVQEAGVISFILESPAPSTAALEAAGGHRDVIGLYLSMLYREVEFCRVGYFVRHEDPTAPPPPPPPEPEVQVEDDDGDENAQQGGVPQGAAASSDAAQEADAGPPEWDKMCRFLSEPCVTRFAIAWDGQAKATGDGDINIEGAAEGLETGDVADEGAEVFQVSDGGQSKRPRLEAATIDVGL